MEPRLPGTITTTATGFNSELVVHSSGPASAVTVYNSAMCERECETGANAGCIAECKEK